MKKEVKNFLLICPLAFLTLVIPSFLWKEQVLSSLLLFLIGLLMLNIDFSFKKVVFYFVVLISGPITEAIAIYFGAWSYTTPIFIGVPIWLFFVWGNSGLYIVTLKDFIFSFNN